MEAIPRRLIALFVAALLAACAEVGAHRSAAPLLPRPPRPLPSPAAFAVVTRDVDGDTVRVVLGGREERVRLIGVDTPEVAWGDRPGACFGAAASAYTRSRLEGRTVGLAFDVARRDRYGRLLAYVFLGPELVNATLVRLGFARADPVPPDTKLAGRFASAERSARAAGRGLWGACPAGG